MLNDHPAPWSWIASRADEVAAVAAAWLTGPALSALARELGGPEIRAIPPDLPTVIEWSQRILDTRGGVERHEAAPAHLPEKVISLLLEAGRGLGLISTGDPALDSYELTVILGGTSVGNALRVGLAADLDRRGTDLGTITGLAAHRPLTTKERSNVSEPSAGRGEWQNLLYEMGRAFGVSTASGNEPGVQPDDFMTARDLEFDRPPRRPIRLLVAPSSDAGRRANTRDSLDYLIRQTPSFQRERVLLVSSSIYAPYQFFTVAPQLIAAGSSHVELVGTQTRTTGDRDVLAQRLAQEINSGILGAERLWN